MSTSTENESTSKKSNLNIIRGLPVSDIFKGVDIEEILDYVPHDGDVIIATYPKTGTTWMQYIVLQILTRGESFPSFNDMLEKVVPFMEMAGVKAVDALTTKPRVYKHHFPYNLMKMNPKSKVIYVYRKPEDTFVSFFHFMKSFDKSIEYEQYFEDFLVGNVSYGRYFEHVLSYLKHKDDENLLLVSYEKLTANRREEILRVAKFLGEEYYEDIVNDESILNKIIEVTSFDYMKKNLTLIVPENPDQPLVEKEGPRKEINFFRKGKIGDGKECLTEDQLLRLKKLMAELMEGTKVLEEWQN